MGCTSSSSQVSPLKSATNAPSLADEVLAPPPAPPPPHGFDTPPASRDYNEISSQLVCVAVVAAAPPLPTTPAVPNSAVPTLLPTEDTSTGPALDFTSDPLLLHQLSVVESQVEIVAAVPPPQAPPSPSSIEISTPLPPSDSLAPPLPPSDAPTPAGVEAQPPSSRVYSSPSATSDSFTSSSVPSAGAPAAAAPYTTTTTATTTSRRVSEASDAPRDSGASRSSAASEAAAALATGLLLLGEEDDYAGVDATGEEPVQPPPPLSFADKIALLHAELAARQAGGENFGLVPSSSPVHSRRESFGEPRSRGYSEAESGGRASPASSVLSIDRERSSSVVVPEVKRERKFKLQEAAAAATTNDGVVAAAASALLLAGKHADKPPLAATANRVKLKWVNQYRMGEVLGRGSYGKVRRCVNEFSGEALAVKIMRKSVLRRKRVGRFGNALQGVQREIAVWKKLDHPHVVRLLEVLDDDSSDKLYLFSELVAGGAVMKDEKEGVPIPLELARRHFCQLMDGLAYLHFHHVVHRDIKPGNLLLDTERGLRITDFGVSQMFEDSDEIRSTAGTAAFLAPEMLTEGGGGFSAKRADLWAAGMTLYMMLYGRPAFLAPSLPAMYALITGSEVPFPPVKSDGAAVDEAAFAPAVDLLRRVLDKNPATRATIPEILAHPFMTGVGGVTARGLPSRVIDVTPEEVEAAITTNKISFRTVVKIAGWTRRQLAGARQRIAASRRASESLANERAATTATPQPLPIVGMVTG